MVCALIPCGLPIADLLLETISAVTTTGLSTAEHIETMDKTFLFTRAWMQWYGGMGLVVLSVTLLMHRSMATFQLLEVPEGQGFVSAVIVYAREVFKVYLLLSVAAVLVSWWGLENWFDGLLHGLSAISTGGFSPYSKSLEDLPFISQLSIMIWGVAGAVALSVYLRIRYEGWRKAIQNEEFKFFLAMQMVVCGVLSLLFTIGHHDLKSSIESGFIMGISALTTTGFANTNIQELDATRMMILIIAMFIGGCIGSTAGGMKVFRLQVFLQLLLVTLRRSSAAPHAVIEPRIQGRVLSSEQITAALLISGLLVLVCVFSWLPFLWYGYSPLASLFEVVSATGTVGLSSGVTSAALPTPLKMVLCFDMVAGRVEVVALLSLFYPGLWIGKRNPDL